jgi:hypothetical protein
MNMYTTGCEFLNIPTSDSSAGDLSVSFDSGETWEVLEAVTPTAARIRVAGPDAEDVPLDAVVLPLGIYKVFVRLVTADETIVRRLGEHLRVIAP